MPKPKVHIAVPEGHREHENSGSESANETVPLKQGHDGTSRQSHASPHSGDSFAFSPLENNGRRSFAATLWNPMSDEERRLFNRRRFIQLVFGIFMGVTIGVQYAFGVFSNNLKVRAGFRQSDMTTITTVANCLFAFTFPAGVLFDYAGPTPVLLLSMTFGVTGFILLAMIFAGVIEPTVATVAIANGLPNWHAGFLESGTLLPSLFMFPTNKGEVVILQKTFFGLGSTFFSLSFDGFFSANEDYQGYCLYTAAIILVAVSAGALVTRLPAYKRTQRELNAIAKMSPIDAERAKMMEEQSFEMHHNPRLSDRRRLNFGVTVLLTTVVFFASLSFIKAFITIPSNAIMMLTFVAVGCIAAFSIMLVPRPFPAFFDYEFLPDIHPPEELMDRPDASKAVNGHSKNDPLLKDIVTDGTGSTLNDERAHSLDTRRAGGSAIGQNEERSNSTIGGDDSGAGRYNHGSPSIGGYGRSFGGDEVADGRASQFMAKRQSIAGGSMIAIPKAVSPMAIPSITTKFTESIRSPFLWCFWFTAFAIMGTNFVFVNNITQIYVALNNGEFVKSSNSLNVALIGIGSAIGRISAGFAETYLHRVNAIHRDKQLEYLAKQEMGALTADDVAPDMTPVYHRWNASVVMAIPLSPLVVGLMCLAVLFVPPAALGVVLIVFAAFVGLFLGLLALCIREIFSVDVAKHLNFVLSAGMFATVLLNRLMFGGWYDEEFDRQTAEREQQFRAAALPSDSSSANGADFSFRAVGMKAAAVNAAAVYAFGNETETNVTFTTTTTVATTVTETETDATTTETDAVTTDATIPSTTEEDTNVTTTDDGNTTTTPAPTADPNARPAECVGVACIRKSLLVLAAINACAVGSISYVVYHWWQVRKTFEA